MSKLLSFLIILIFILPFVYADEFVHEITKLNVDFGSDWQHISEQVDFTCTGGSDDTYDSCYGVQEYKTFEKEIPAFSAFDYSAECESPQDTDTSWCSRGNTCEVYYSKSGSIYAVGDSLSYFQGANPEEYSSDLTYNSVSYLSEPTTVEVTCWTCGTGTFNFAVHETKCKVDLYYKTFDSCNEMCELAVLNSYGKMKNDWGEEACSCYCPDGYEKNSLDSGYECVKEEEEPEEEEEEEQDEECPCLSGCTKTETFLGTTMCECFGELEGCRECDNNNPCPSGKICDYGKCVEEDECLPYEENGKYWNCKEICWNNQIGTSNGEYEILTSEHQFRKCEIQCKKRIQKEYVDCLKEKGIDVAEETGITDEEQAILDKINNEETLNTCEFITYIKTVEKKNPDMTWQQIISELHQESYPEDARLSIFWIPLFTNGDDNKDYWNVDTLVNTVPPRVITLSDGTVFNTAHTYAGIRAGLNRVIGQRWFMTNVNTGWGDSVQVIGGRMKGIGQMAKFWQWGRGGFSEGWNKFKDAPAHKSEDQVLGNEAGKDMQMDLNWDFSGKSLSDSYREYFKDGFGEDCD